ncbi:hypothetical protein GCM10023090_24890 [Acidovorax lacteus]|uniref:DUF2145 domain-containing protein n=1 Tax=Acidovorax lacteus TaxID=1924988 RepID=A0ABP8LD89_9BURK
MTVFSVSRSRLSIAVALRRTLRPALLASAVAALAACAPLQPDRTEAPVGRARLVLPDAAWKDLGVVAADALPSPFRGAGLPLETRAAVLHDAQGQVLAAVLLQTNATNHPRTGAAWQTDCPREQGLLVDDRATSPVRVDCLRFKRWADQAGWATQQHPEMMRWLQAHKAVPARPYSHLSYRYGTEAGAFVQVHALADQRLLRPATRSNEEFLHAGVPARDWSRQVADAARLSTAMLDGHFALPAFPLPVPQ